eukprot:TRINITY_DN4414_c0_g1_i2.p1 TRINITY_DN4414_c0_g1~~TRINITY_DN4414_c0_g1_i2.p1  ORF type:complete len:1533 (+),score=213.80 TRINITY_DN4414_c0_g1_i2:36-4634(+)
MVPLFICILVSVTALAEASRIPTFQIGTVENGTDVVGDGIVYFSYLPMVHTASVSGSQVQWHLRNTNVTHTIPLTYIAIQERPIREAICCHPSITGFQPGELSNKTEMVITIIFNCTCPGMFVIDINFMFAPFQSLIMAMEKVEGQYRDGFMMGTSPGYSDVLSNSVALPLWNNVNSARTIVHNTLTFYIIITNGTQAYSAPTAIIDPPGIFTINFTGDAAEGGILRENTTSVLTMDFTCTNVSKAHVTINIPIEGYLNGSFGFFKECELEILPINIGTSIKRHDVVDDGIVQLPWMKDLGTIFRNWYENEVQFFFQLHPGADMPGTPDVSFVLNTTKPQYCHPYLKSPIPTQITNSSQNFTVVYNCSLPSDANQTIAKFSVRLDVLQTKNAIPKILRRQSMFNSTQELDEDALIQQTNTGVGEVMKRTVEFWWRRDLHMDYAPIGIGVSDPTCKHDRAAQEGFATMEFQPLVHTFFVLGWKDYSHFNLHLTNRTGVAFAKIKNISVTTLGANNGNCTVSLVEGPEKLSKSGTLILPQVCYNMTIQHTCLIGGETTTIGINVTVENYPSINLVFSKFSGGRRDGFNVGSKPFGFDVVLAGITMPLWNLDIFQDGGFHTTSGTQNNDTFYIWMDDPDAIQNFSVSLSSIVPITLTGPAANGGVASQNNSLAITVNYNCTGPILDNPVLTLSLPPYTTVNISWEKQCGTMIPLYVGTRPGDRSIVSGGVVQPLWRPTCPESKQHTELQEVLGIRLWFTAETKDAISTQYVSVTPIDTFPNVSCSPWFNHTFHELQSENQYMDIIYNCTGKGEIFVNLFVLFEGPFIPLSLRWKKAVGGPRIGLMAGSTPDYQRDIIADGQAQGDWASPTGRVIDENMYNITLWLWIEATPSLMNSEQNLEGFELTSEPTITVSRSAYLPTISSIPQPIFFIFSCYVRKDNSDLVSIQMDIPGFDSVLLNMAKFCPPYNENVQVGTTNLGDDVVRAGVARPPWSFLNHTIAVDGNTFNTSFFVHLSSSSTESSLAVDDISCWINDMRCHPVVYSNLVEITKEPQELIVSYNCSERGIAEVGLIIVLATENTNVFFSWTKVTGNTIREGFNVGSSPYAKDVVVNGQVTRNWQSPFNYGSKRSFSETKPLEHAKEIDKRRDVPNNHVLNGEEVQSASGSVQPLSTNDHVALVPTETGNGIPRTVLGSIKPHLFGKALDSTVWYYSFYFSMSAMTTYPVQHFNPPDIRLDVEYPCTVDTTGPATKGGESNLNSRDLHFTTIYSCPHPGNVTITVTVHIPPFNPLSWQWIKVSSGQAVALTVTSLDPNVTYAANTSPLIFTSGLVTNGWNSKDINSTNIPRIDSRKNSTSFIYKMLNAPEVGVYPIMQVSPVTVTAVGLPGCVLEIGGNGSIGGWIGGQGLISFVVDITFDNSICDEKNSVLIEVDFAFTSGYENFTFYFRRDKWVEPTAPLPSWAIIAIVLGCLLSVFVAFAGVNYCVMKNIEASSIVPAAFQKKQFDPSNINIQESDLDEDTHDSSPLLHVQSWDPR